MVHEVARCPYCKGSICLDDVAPEIQFTNEEGEGPCPHLTSFLVHFEAYRVLPFDDFTFEPRRSGSWIFEYGRRPRRVRHSEEGPFGSYLLDLVYDALKPDEIPDVHFEVVGGDSNARSFDQPGTGRFALADPEDAIVAELHAWAVFSLRPRRFVAFIRRLLCPQTRLLKAARRK